MSAQAMSPTERDVWNTVRAMNRAWTSGRVEDLRKYFHQDMVAVTPDDRLRLEGRQACVDAWRRFVGGTDIRGWKEIDPRVNVFGETAVVGYYYEVECLVEDAEVTVSGRDLLTLVRQEGRWLVAADQFSGFPDAPSTPPATRKDIEATARRWMALWQGGDLAAFDELHSADFVDHSPAGRSSDRQGFRQGIHDLYQAFPDFHAAIEDLVADPASGKVTVRWTATGTHEGEFLGHLPTGKLVSFIGIEIICIKASRVTERWGEWDGLDILGQIESGSPRHSLTILAVKDLDRAAWFYKQAFGWPVRVQVPVYVEFALPDGRGFGLYCRDGFARNTGQAPAQVSEGEITGTEVYLHCHDLDAAVARLEGAGARLLSGRVIRDWGDEAAYFADLDGNVIVVARAVDG